MPLFPVVLTSSPLSTQISMAPQGRGAQSRVDIYPGPVRVGSTSDHHERLGNAHYFTAMRKIQTLIEVEGVLAYQELSRKEEEHLQAISASSALTEAEETAILPQLLSAFKEEDELFNLFENDASRSWFKRRGKVGSLPLLYV